MKRIVIIALLALAAWKGYGEYQTGTITQRINSFMSSNGAIEQPRQDFRCDGRTYCSQMTSCAEATFFLKNCPGVRMDGNHDGIPCEKQWCS